MIHCRFYNTCIILILYVLYRVYINDTSGSFLYFRFLAFFLKKKNRTREEEKRKKDFKKKNKDEWSEARGGGSMSMEV